MVSPLIFLCLLWFKEIAASEWSYEGETGPSNWPGLFLSCGGSRQSPINIETGNVLKEFWKPFIFQYYDDTPTRMRIKNNGHSAQVEMDATHAPRISEGGMMGNYIFAQFHFHWGSDSSQGSEHTINGVRYPMELHVVHYKSQYGSLTEAIRHPDGLAVLGVLFEVGATDNAAFQPLVNSLENINAADSVSDVTANYPLSAYLPSDRESYFRYLGSLTTPTCNEVVVWTVFRQPVSISETQLEAFRVLLDTSGNPIVDNFRPPQLIRNRKIYVSASGCFGGSQHMREFTWSYGKLASQWSDHFKMCAGKQQSPINLNGEDVIDFTFKPFTFKNYDMPPSSITVKNNGHTAQVDLKQANGPTVSGGGLPGIYRFSQFHFHWGSNSSQGAEHTIDNERYPLELHLVHYRESYGSLQKAVNEPDGLAVFGVFFQTRKKDNKDLKSVIDALHVIKTKGTEISIPTMTLLSSLIPKDTQRFYRYEGSLTTPTCNEAVIWTLFEKPLYISEAQLRVFRELKGEDDHFISDNFRPLQSVNGREIFRNNLESGSPSLESTGIVFTLCLLCYNILL